MDWNFTSFLEHRSKPFLVFFGLALFAAVLAVDQTADWQIASSVIYILPVSFFAWYFSPRMGMLFGLLSVISWLYFNHSKTPQYSSAVAPYWNAVIHLTLYMIVVFLFAEIKALYHQERVNSRLDFLTGVINQRGFYEALGRERERASRLNLPLTLAYLDLDDFKQVNDRFDHMTGDQVLAAVGEALRTCIRKTDLAGRLGGDEFCLLLPHTDANGARVFIDRVQETLSTIMRSSGWPTTFSIGVVTFLETTKSAEEMLRTADCTMYAAKETGKNHILYTTDPSIRVLSMHACR